MHRFLIFTLAFAITGLAGLTGCGKKPEEPKYEDVPVAKATDKKKSGGAKGGTKTAIKAGDGTLKGKITLDGAIPAYVELAAVADAKNKSCCLAPDDQKFQNIDQSLIVGKDKGVANVVVMLKAASGTYFEPAESDKKREKPAVVDQPFCAFVPNVSVMFPAYYDGKGLVPTGQELIVKNSASCPHNTKVNVDTSKNDDKNVTLKPGGAETIKLNPQGDTPVTLKCDFHPWMSASIFVLDHPYGVVTGQDGTFELKNLPVGSKINVVVWHPQTGYLNEGGKAGQEIEIPAGGTKELNLTIKGK